MLRTDHDVGRTIGTDPPQRIGIFGLSQAAVFQTPDDDARSIEGGDPGAQGGKISGRHMGPLYGPCSSYVLHFYRKDSGQERTEVGEKSPDVRAKPHGTFGGGRAL